uniref:Uncharacterized protein n=1 Tax=Anas platyrhynchos platyrhynchos TaxID=8840 RepID=A0A493SX07_ANAPP
MEQACEVSRRSCLVPFGTSLAAAEPKGGPFGEARGPEPPAMQLAAAKPVYGQDPSSCYIPLRRLQDLASMINAEYLGGAADGAEALPDPGSPPPPRPRGPAGRRRRPRPGCRRGPPGLPVAPPGRGGRGGGGRGGRGGGGGGGRRRRDAGGGGRGGGRRRRRGGGGRRRGGRRWCPGAGRGGAEPCGAAAGPRQPGAAAPPAASRAAAAGRRGGQTRAFRHGGPAARADSCVESSDLPTAAPLSFTQLRGIAVFFCRRLSSRTHCECLWHRIWCRAKPERGHVAAGRPVRAAPCPGEIFTGSCKRTRCPGCCSGQQLRGVVMPSKTCWGFSAAPQGPDQQVPSGEG